MRPSPEALREQVQRQLRQAGRGAPVELMRAQAQAVSTGVSDVVELLRDAEAGGASIPALLTSGESCLSRELLDQKLALQLPLLMRPEFTEFVRRGLEKVRSPEQQLALLELNRYVLGAYEEMADGVVDLQWQQLNKMRELCGLPARAPSPPSGAARGTCCSRAPAIVRLDRHGLQPVPMLCQALTGPPVPSVAPHPACSGPVSARQLVTPTHASVGGGTTALTRPPSRASIGATRPRMAVLKACRRWPK